MSYDFRIENYVFQFIDERAFISCLEEYCQNCRSFHPNVPIMSLESFLGLRAENGDSRISFQDNTIMADPNPPVVTSDINIDPNRAVDLFSVEDGTYNLDNTRIYNVDIDGNLHISGDLYIDGNVSIGNSFTINDVPKEKKISENKNKVETDRFKLLDID